MKLRLRTRTRINIRLRNRLRNVAAVATMLSLIAGIFFLYEFIGRVSDSRAAQLESQNHPQAEVLEGFAGRKKLSVLLDQIPANESLYNFPVLVSLRMDELKRVQDGGMVSGRDGEDLVFTSADGQTILPFQIERYEPASGKLLAWVRFDTLDQIHHEAFLYYGKTDATSLESPLTFAKPYEAVWHFNRGFQTDCPLALAGEYRSVKDEEGRFAAAKDFMAYDGSHMLFESKNELKFSGDITVSAWIKSDIRSVDQTIVSTLSREGGFSLWIDKNGSPSFEIMDKNGRTASLDKQESITKLEAGKWYQLTGVYSAQTDSLQLFINGKLDKSMKAGQMYVAGGNLAIGSLPGGDKSFYNGIIDELRISSSALTSQFIATSYLSESDPEHFFTIDNQEVFSASPRLVNMKNLESSVNVNHVTVRWQAMEESNLDYYSLERSSDGKLFKGVGRVLGKGSSEEANAYFIIDTAPSFGTAFYRVRSTSFKGESQVSEILTTHIAEPISALGIKHVEPNPFKDNFQVSYKTENPGDIEVKLTSISGQVVYTSMIQGSSEKDNLFDFKSPQNLRPGIYFLSLQQNEEQKTVKLIKQL
jgi:hypothetical protein